MSEVFIQEESINGTVNATDVYVGDDVVKSVNGILPDKKGKLEIFIPELDATLTLPDKAADAKAVGDLLTKLRADMPTAVSQLENDAEYVVQDEIIPFVVFCSKNEGGNLQIDKDFTDILTALESGRQAFLVMQDDTLPVVLPLAGLAMDDDMALLGADLSIAGVGIVHFIIFPGGHVEEVFSEWAKPDDIPTNVSELTNDADYVTEGELDEFADEFAGDLEAFLEPYIVEFYDFDFETHEAKCTSTYEEIVDATFTGRTILTVCEMGDSYMLLSPMGFNQEEGTVAVCAALPGSFIMFVIAYDADGDYVYCLREETPLMDDIKNTLFVECWLNKDFEVYSYSGDIETISTAIENECDVICKVCLDGESTAAYLPLYSADSEYAMFGLELGRELLEVDFTTDGVQLHVSDTAPDWNVSAEWEEGYIKNRTHYTEWEITWDGEIGDRYTVDWGDITLVRVADLQSGDIEDAVVDVIVEGDTISVPVKELNKTGSMVGPSYGFGTTDIIIFNMYGYGGLDPYRPGIYFGLTDKYHAIRLRKVKPLDAAYIPDEIPTKDFVTKELDKVRDEIPAIPADVSAFNNDAGYVTAYCVNVDYDMEAGTATTNCNFDELWNACESGYHVYCDVHMVMGEEDAIARMPMIEFADDYVFFDITTAEVNMAIDITRDGCYVSFSVLPSREPKKFELIERWEVTEDGITQKKFNFSLEKADVYITVPASDNAVEYLYGIHKYNHSQDANKQVGYSQHQLVDSSRAKCTRFEFGNEAGIGYFHTHGVVSTSTTEGAYAGHRTNAHYIEGETPFTEFRITAQGQTVPFPIGMVVKIYGIRAD